MGKWAKYSRKYRKAWEQEEWAKGWLQENTFDKNSVNDAYCKVCKCALRSHVTDLKKHGNGKHHAMKMKMLLPPVKNNQLPFTLDISNESKENDIKLAVFIAIHSSVRSIDHLGEMLSGMCTGSKLEKLKLHRTKCSGIIKYVIAPVLLKDLLHDLGDNTPYSLIIDESTDISVVKYLCVCVKYFSNCKFKLVTSFLGLVPLENGTAVVLYETAKNFLSELKLPIKNLIGIGTDGANSLCGSNNSFYTLFKKDVPNLKLVRCVCHSLNNSGSKASEMLPANVDFLCKEIFNYFSCSSNRRVEYKKIFDIINIGEDKKFHQFIQLSTTRWLARYNVVNVILENWLELKTHFNLLVTKEKCYTSRLIADMLNDYTNYLYFKFLKPILYELNVVNLNFQRENLDLGKAYDDLETLFLIFCKKVVRDVFVNEGTAKLLQEVQGRNELIFKKCEDVDFGVDYYQACNRVIITSEQKTNLEYKMSQYLKSLVHQLSLRLLVSLDHFKNIKYISPKTVLAQIRPEFSKLPFLHEFADPGQLGTLENQYLKLPFVDWSQCCDNVYSFWITVFQYEDSGGSCCFQELAKYALTILSLPSSNAIVERVFSLMNGIKTKFRNKMQLEMINSILNLKVHMINDNICCKNFKVSPQMIKEFKADIVYKSKDSSDTTEAADSEVFEMFEGMI